MKPGWVGGESTSETSTMEFGKDFSQYLEKGDIIKLQGELGTGKTTFVKGVAEKLGYTRIVSSPTFTLINEYPSKPTIIHIDCFREKNIDRWNLIGIRDYFTDENIIIIEWPKVLEPVLPEYGVYEITLSHISENIRKITLKQ